jgi:DNA (cytosine-5)-methyltransferase 1
VKAVSLFSGVGGFEIGLQRAGIETVLQCEIDKWALAVLRRHWPQIPKVNDVRDISLASWNRLGGTEEGAGRAVGNTGSGVDLVYGGFPCQPFSVAGKRAGDRDDRNLWPEFRRVVSELRPSWVLAENVVGLLSIDEGRFFGGILDDLGDLGFEGVAYAVLDSQFFAIPQRRARVFVVAGPSRRGAEQVLSICEGCSGHPPTGREAREGVAAASGGRSAGTGRGGEDDANLIAFGVGGGEVGYALRADASHSGDKGDGGLNTSLVAAPLAGHHHRDDLDNDTYVVAKPVRPGGEHWKGADHQDFCVVSDTLRNHPRPGSNSLGAMTVVDTAYAITARESKGVSKREAQTNYVMGGAGLGVRRLTPLECERLMGWPDGWTEFTDDGRRIPDSQRYKLIGNGVVATVAEWIGRRLVAVANSSQLSNV